MSRFQKSATAFALAFFTVAVRAAAPASADLVVTETWFTGKQVLRRTQH